MRALALLVVVMQSLLLRPAIATPVPASTAVFTSVRVCTIVDDKCDRSTQVAPLSYGGRGGDVSASSRIDYPAYGSAFGSVSLSGTIGAPIFRNDSSAAPGGRMNAVSVALQRYTYTGAAETTRTFGGDLTYAQHLTGPHPESEVGDGIYAFIDVFKTSLDLLETGGTEESNMDALLDVESLPGIEHLGFSEYWGRESTDTGLGRMALTVALSPGDTVWVRGLLRTPAIHRGWTDASHTFVTAWDDSSNLVPGAFALSSPGSLTLVGLAGLALGLRRRRVRRSRYCPAVRR